MDRRELLVHLWRHLEVAPDSIEACSRDYDLLCPHCRGSGRGEVHLKVLPDDTGFQCVGIGHEYRWHPAVLWNLAQMNRLSGPGGKKPGAGTPLREIATDTAHCD